MKVKRFSRLINESMKFNMENLNDLFQEWSNDMEGGKISIGHYRSDKSGNNLKDDYTNTHDRFRVQFSSSMENTPLPYENSISKKMIDPIDSKIDLLSDYNILMGGHTLSLINKEEKYTRNDIDSLKILKQKLKDNGIISHSIQNGLKADVSLDTPSKIMGIIKGIDIAKDKFNVSYNNGSWWVYITLK